MSYTHVVILIKARGFHGALRKHSLLHQKFKYFYKIIEINTFQTYSADSKLSTNTYLMSVAAVFQKLQVKVDVTLVQF